MRTVQAQHGAVTIVLYRLISVGGLSSPLSFCVNIMCHHLKNVYVLLRTAVKYA